MVRTREAAQRWVVTHGASLSVAVVFTALAFWLKLVFAAYLGPPYILFYPAVMLSAVVGGLASGLVSTALASFLAIRFILPQAAQPGPIGTPELVSLLTFAGMGVFMSLVGGLYRRARGERERLTLERTLREREAGSRRLVEEAQRRYQLLASSARDFIFFIRAADGRIVDANPAAVSAYGYELEELLSLTVHELRAPGERALVARDLARADREGLRFETLHQRKDGSTFPVEVSSQGVDMGGTRMVLSIVRDASTRKAAEQRLQASEARLRLFVEHTPASVAMFDRELRYLAVSLRYVQDLRPQVQDLVGRRHYDVFPEIPERWKEIHRKVLAGEVLGCAEDPFPRPDGTTDWIRWELHPWRGEDGAVGGILLFSEVITERKQAEQRLAAERERLAVTLESIGDAVIATDREARITVFNHVAARLTGWTVTEALGRPFQEVFRIVSEEDRQVRESPVERVLREGAVVGLANHTTLLARDGTERPIADSGAPIRDAGGAIRGVVLVFRDQTAERRAEQALRESERRFRMALRNSPVTVALQDRNLRYLWAYNQVITRPEEILGRTDDDLFPPQEAAHLRALKRRVLDEGVELREQLWLTRPEGRIFLDTYLEPVRDAEGRVTGVGVATVNLTPERLAEIEVREREERLAVTLRSIADAVIATDEGGRVTLVNAVAEQLTGWPAAEAVGRPLGDVFRVLGERSRQPVPSPVDRVLQEGAAVGLANGTLLVARDGTERPIAERGAPIRDAGGAMRGVVLVFRDQTAEREAQRLRREAEERLAASEERFRQAQKLESVGRLAGGVAHDFNNLLTVILSCTSELDKALTAGRPAGLDEVREIDTAARRAAELTGQLLAFARKQLVTPVPLDVGKVVAGNEGMLRRLLGEDVELRVELEPAPWTVRADPSQVTQVVVNLAVNARDAMPAGGKLLIRTSNISAACAGRAAGPEAAPADWVRITIRDSGAGMSAEVKAHLFEPFFTTKEQGKGTGLGLATVYGIVQQAGGHVHVSSEPGQGTTVDVCLPRVHAEVAETARPAAGQEAPGGSERILVVEDDPQVRAVTVRTLRGAGYDVLALAHPQAALELQAAQLDRLQLLISDVVMPGLDGRELAVELHRRHTALRTLFLSGYTPDSIAAHGALDPGIDLLAKPFTGADLLTRVRAVLDRA